ncbi:hypothetical protein D3C87_1162070 [compost metagenome]
MTASAGAAASVATVGSAVTKRWKYSITAATWVCWSMISDSQIRYGSRVFCHGRSCRPCVRCHVTTRAPKSSGTAMSGLAGSVGAAADLRGIAAMGKRKAPLEGGAT